MKTLFKITNKLFGSRNNRVIKKYQKQVTLIRNLENEFKKLSDNELALKTISLRKLIENNSTPNDILPEAFATVIEATDRVMGIRHYDSQIIAAICLFEGNVAEMATGEGKTLMATLPAYLHSVSNKGSVHIVTVNDYLATRDSENIGKIFSFLNLEVGVVVSGQSPEDRKSQYLKDIIYATNNELGFDYLKDNMVQQEDQKVQQKLSFAIIDEVDSILIDEARTPLIISGPSNESVEIYKIIKSIISDFSEQIETGSGKTLDIATEGHFTLDRKHKSSDLSELGFLSAEQKLLEANLLQENDSLYDSHNIKLVNLISSAIRAKYLFLKDSEYLVNDNNEIVIIDELTGRAMKGRRWSDGLHQAIEAKENVEIQKESQTLASITFQNYFRLYGKLSGMTGTADTEAPELLEIYGMEVIIIPPNMPSKRIDDMDKIYSSLAAKNKAIFNKIKNINSTGQPILVGTSSVDASEKISNILSKNNIKHSVLNAKNHENEASIIADAGKLNSVTIATNMAGRGTDIVLGGSPEHYENTDSWTSNHNKVIDLGGLFVLGTERNESRRVDNQLRGRSGRQGDPGNTCFFLSLEDNLLKIFGGDKSFDLVKKLGLSEDDVIEHNIINKVIENAQRKVEGMNYDARKNLLEYDNISNEQRRIIYKIRHDILSGDNTNDFYYKFRKKVVLNIFDEHISPLAQEEDWPVKELIEIYSIQFGITFPISEWLEQGLDLEAIRNEIISGFEYVSDFKTEAVGPDQMELISKSIILQSLDHHWKEHLSSMDYLQKSVGLRGLAAKNPIQEFKKEAFDSFEYLLDLYKIEATKAICSIRVSPSEEDQELIDSSGNIEIVDDAEIIDDIEK